MPDKDYYRQKLLKNIEAIRQICPEFTMTEEQMEECLSNDKIQVHENLQNYEPPFRGENLKARRETVKKYVDFNNLKEMNSGLFTRIYYHVIRDEKTPEDIAYNKRIFTNLTRDDELGETARENFILECINTVFRIDTDKFGPNVPLSELADYAASYSDLGGIAMENEHAVGRMPFGHLKDPDKVRVAFHFGASVGGYLRNLASGMKDESFLTFPVSYLTDEQLLKLIENKNKLQTSEYIKASGTANISSALTMEQFKRGLSKDISDFKAAFNGKGPFTAADFEYDVPQSERVGGGYPGRRDAILQGIDILLHADCPVQSDAIDNMKRELAAAKTLLTEENYLNDDSQISAFVSQVKRTARALYNVRGLREIKNSKDPAVVQFRNYVNAEMNHIKFFENENMFRDLLHYDALDKAHVKEAKDSTNLALKELDDMMSPLNMLNEYGEKEALTQGDIYELRSKMSEIMTACQNKLEDPETDKMTRSIMTGVYNQVAKQFKAMNRAVPGMTLDSALAGKARELDMTGHEFKSVGNLMSSRKMMTVTGEDGSRQKGFFTTKTEYNDEKTKNAIADQISKLYPKDAQLCGRIVDFLLTDPGRRQLEEFINTIQAESQNVSNIIEQAKPQVNRYLSDKAKFQAMTGVEGERIRVDSRNVAMSDVASLIGAEEIIAKSTYMTLYNNGVPIEGTFMEEARGVDIDHIKKDSPFLSVKEDCLDYSPALKQISDLQVLDYICGNVDRHAGNLFYQFDENGKIQGIVGIDNDTSFMNHETMFNSRFTTLQNMKYVSRSMAEKLKTITPEMLKACLQGNELGESEINMASTRLNALKTAIQNGTVPVMEDAEFQTHKFSDFLIDNKVNTYSVVQAKLQEVMQMDPHRRQQIMDQPDASKKDRDVLDLFRQVDKNMFTQDIAPVDGKLQSLQAAERHVFFGSREYKNVKNSLRRINEINRTASGTAHLVGKDKLKLLQEAYQKVIADCNKYIERKRRQGKLNATGKTGRRIAAVRDVLAFCRNKTRSIEATLNPHHVDKDQLDARNERDRAIIEGLNPQLAGDIIKEMNQLASGPNASTREILYAADKIKIVAKYMQEKNVDATKCGLEKNDLLEAQKTIKAGRTAYAMEHPEAMQKPKKELKESKESKESQKKDILIV